jgi:hypothetical protein
VIRLANDSKGKGGERQFNGLVDVYVKTIKSDGIQGLYRGFVISAVGIFIYRYLQTTISINLPFGVTFCWVRIKTFVWLRIFSPLMRISFLISCLKTP